MKKKIVLGIMLAYGSSNVTASLSGIGQGLESMVGIVPAGHKAHFQIINDVAGTVTAGYKSIISVMGSYEPTGGMKSVKSFQPYQSTLVKSSGKGNDSSGLHTAFSDIPYYFAWYFSENNHTDPSKDPFFKKYYITLNKKDDATVQYWHTFRNAHIGYKPTAEIFGSYDPDAKKGATSQSPISAQLDTLHLYNNTPQTMKIEYTLQEEPYVKTELGAYTWGTITAPKKQSLRPGTLVATDSQSDAKVTVPIAEIGPDNKAPQVDIYTEKGELKAAIQGYTVGNHRQQAVKPAQDLSPQKCVLWYQSAAQEAASSHKHNEQPEKYAYDLPGQVWMAYKRGGVMSMQAVNPGQAIELVVQRPVISQGQGMLYFFYIPTNDTKNAQYFIHQVVSGKAGYNVVHAFEQHVQDLMQNMKSVKQNSDDSTDVAQLSPQQLQQALTGAASQAGPRISVTLPDSQGALSGYFLGADFFLPTGANQTEYYYMLTPSLLVADSLVTKCKRLLDAGLLQKHGQDTQLPKLVQDWITQYPAQPDKVASKVQEYVLKYGQSTLVQKGRTGLTSAGIARLKSLLYGSISFANPPILYRSIVPLFPGDTAPKDMPDIANAKKNSKVSSSQKKASSEK